MFNGIFMKNINSLQEEGLISIAIFASGAGSNAQKIIDYFRNHSRIRVALIVCNKLKAGVLEIAEKESIPTLIIEKNMFAETGYVHDLHHYSIDFIVLAGFLWKIPPVLIRSYPDNIINIHPALLPKYGGKGMWGHHVHEAVLNAGEKESGATVHYVTSGIDEGEIILQKSFEISENETLETLAEKIHEIEYEIFPKAINIVLGIPL